MKINICIPSKWRVWKITTLDFFIKYKKNITIYTESKEFIFYKEFYKEFKVVDIWHNDKWIWKTRKKILIDNLDSICVMIDDDIIKVIKDRKKHNELDSAVDLMISKLNWKTLISWLDSISFNYFNYKKEKESKNVKFFQCMCFDVNKLLSNSIKYDNNLTLFEDIDLLIQTIIKWFEIVRINNFAIWDFSFKERISKNKKITWAWEFWEKKWESKRNIEYLFEKYWDSFMKKIIDNKWYDNFIIYFKKIWNI